MHADTSLKRPPVPDAAEISLFLDVDGTLLEFAPKPDAVVVSDALKALLTELATACDGALALISGRSIASLDRLFGALALPMAGSHGLEIRAGGRTHRLGIPLPESTLSRLRAIADEHPGSLLEVKQFGAALHYREAPEHALSLTGHMRALSSDLGNGFELIEGNNVLELTAASGDKGSAIRFLCAREPWLERQPVFVGDDTTDEPGFEAVNALGGMAVRVGARPGTAARWQLDSVGDVQAWLRSLAQRR